MSSTLHDYWHDYIERYKKTCLKVQQLDGLDDDDMKEYAPLAPVSSEEIQN